MSLFIINFFMIFYWWVVKGREEVEQEEMRGTRFSLELILWQTKHFEKGAE